VLIENRQWDALRQRLTALFERNAVSVDAAENVVNQLFMAASAPALQIADTLIHQMLQQQPESPVMNKALAILYQMRGMTSQCAEIYARVLESNPDDLVAINNLAWIICEEHNDYQKALALAQRGLQTTPDYADLLDTRGVIYYRMSEYQKAVRDFSRCAELYPENSASMGITRYHLGKTFAALGQTDRAIDNLTYCLDAGRKYGGLSGSQMQEAQKLLEKLLRNMGQMNNASQQENI
jgi:tetratricopeptide (TPR) repeat protein